METYRGPISSENKETPMDYRIELVILPVSDVDRAKAFYGDTLGWPVDHDQVVDENTRFVQVTPPGSACSIAFGLGLSEMAPGSLKAIQVVVGSADEALADVTGRGVEAQGVDDQPWGRFVYFTDPDGNSWTLQELPDWSAQK
jgi:catechol 2,3-dioxygenase-like lactoylglutathione lyase family enzyme